MADVKFKYGNQDKYENIEPDEYTFYRIEDDDSTEVYLGDILLSGLEVHQMPGPKSIFGNNTPDLIKQAVTEGTAQDLWSVGDTIAITLNGDVSTYTFDNETYYAFIIGFDHNAELETNGKHSLTLQFGKTKEGTDICFDDPNYYETQSSTKTGFRMNASNSNSGGWYNSWMRTEICPAFYNALPSEWQNVVGTIIKYTDNVGSENNTPYEVTDQEDQIFLLAEYEAIGNRTYANSTEQEYQQQYDYYAAGNSLMKYPNITVPNNNESWWLRSPYSKTSEEFVYIWGTISSGACYCDTTSANYDAGFAPAFCIVAD